MTTNDTQENAGRVPDARFAEAIRRFDQANAQDPKTDVVDGKTWPGELLYAIRLSEWVDRLAPGASEPLRLAARCQHIRRWAIPRDSYPKTRAGYLQWREKLKRFHAEAAGQILREIGFPEATIARVQELNLKRGFPQDPESRVLEDALCLVFLQHQLGKLAAEHPREKVVSALRKSWEKMTPAARAIALRLRELEAHKEVVQAALGSDREPGP